VLDRTDAPTVEVASMMKSAAMLEIGRDVVVLVGGIALVLWAMDGASRPSHWVHLVVGILVLISPWMLQFPAGVGTADLVAVIVGIAATVAGVLGILAVRRARIQTPPTQVKRGSYLSW